MIGGGGECCLLIVVAWFDLMSAIPSICYYYFRFYNYQWG